MVWCGASWHGTGTESDGTSWCSVARQYLDSPSTATTMCFVVCIGVPVDMRTGICEGVCDSSGIHATAGSAASGFKVLTSEGETCASAGLAAITSAAECQRAISAVNAATGKKGHGSVRTKDDSFRPSGCSAFSNMGKFGYYHSYFNMATTAHGVGSNAKGIFCKASSSASGTCYACGRTCK